MARTAFVWLAYFCLLAWAAMPQGMDTVLVPFGCPRPGAEDACRPDALTPRSTNADIIRLYTLADAAVIAGYARDNIQHGNWTQTTGWPLWPPGMTLIETALYRLDSNLPVGLALILLECALWAAVFTQMRFFLKNLHPLVAAATPLLLLAAHEFSYYFHVGVFYTESFSTAFFLLGIGMLLQSVRERKNHLAIAAGLLLALSAYLRAQTDLVMSLAAGAFLASALVALMRRRARPFPTWLMALVIALLSYHAATLPYRAAHGMRWIDMQSNPMWPPTWDHKSDLPPILQFYIDGGGVEGCTVDPAQCAAIHQARANGTVYSAQDYYRFTVASVLEHPLGWAQAKAPYLWHYWMQDGAESWLLTLLLLILLYRPRSDETRLAALLLLCGAAGILGPPLLSHFEPRYLYQFTMLILYLALLRFAPGSMTLRKLILKRQDI